MISESDKSDIHEMIEKHGTARSAIIPLLQSVQQKYHYLPQDVLKTLGDMTEITPADIAGVSTFYSQFRHKPAGKHTIKVCIGTACHVKGATRIVDAVRRHLKISDAEDTDAERLFTVEPVACLGCCTLAPAVQIDDVTYGHLTPATVDIMINDFLSLKDAGSPDAASERPEAQDGLAEIRVGLGSCCVAGGSKNVFESLEEEIVKQDLPVRVKTVGCVGMCHQTPLVEVVENNGSKTLYAKVTPRQTHRILDKHFAPSGLVGKLTRSLSSALDQVLTDEEWEPVARHAINVRDDHVSAFLDRQKHIASEFCGQIAPLDIDEYTKNGGFEALTTVLRDSSAEQVIDTVRESQLRGRGGAGFSVGTKWSIVRSAEGPTKYIIMNGDEGDPGAFMDRMLLESYPYRILEGIAIAAFAVGAQEGILYIRAEYPLAVQRITDAIEICRTKGFLGKNIGGTGFNLELRVMEGAGAFVCGEETALLASLAGQRGMPRIRPPYPAHEGYKGCPTLINNVETYACIPWIIRNGAEAFADLGSSTSKGTKVFSLTGKIRRGGLIEVPMGISIREIVEQIGGGVGGDRQFKAVQIGGPSGGCLPAEACDTPIDYEALISAGAIMGSGGLVVLDDADCMVDIARYFLEFTQQQSCGKCTFCRVGTRRMLDILERLCSGGGRKGDIEKLETLAVSVKAGSLCGLGGTAPNPVISTIRYFRHEYEAHINGRCPAGKCESMIRYKITDDCIGCTLCSQRCPVDAIEMKPYEKHIIDVGLCTKCDTCRQVCPANAIEIVTAGTAGAKS